MEARNLNKKHVVELRKKVKNVFLDCDGVIWRWPVVLDGATDCLNFFVEKLKWNVYFVTNNSTKTRDTFVKRLKEMGYRYAHEDNVLCTSWLTKEYLLSINYKGPLYLLGHSAIREELKNSGISFYTDELLMNEKGHFEKNEISTGDLCNKEKPVDQPITYDKGLVALDTLQPNILRDDITGVVLAFDSEITYEKMFKAINYICREKNEHYIITNQDMTFPSRHNDKNGKALVYPGTGSCLSSITECVDSVNPKKIPTIIGKPGNVLIRILNGIRKKSNLEEINVNECLMIGDRLDTDILWANNNKFAYTLHLTETGVNNLNDLERLTKINQELTPSFYTTSIQSFLNLLKD